MLTKGYLTLGEFEVTYITCDYPDYFQGFGVAFTPFSHCVVGSGYSEAEALEDCLEMLAQSGLVDYTEEMEKQIKGEYGSCEDGYPDGWDSEEYPRHYIGLRFNIKEEERYKRIRKLENIEPMEYCSYEALYPSKDNFGLMVHGYIRRIEDNSAYYGDIKPSGWPKTVQDYFSTIYNDSGELRDKEETAELYFFVPYATYSNYSGSSVERSNCEVFLEYQDQKDKRENEKEEYYMDEWIKSVYGGHNTTAALIGLTGLLTCSDDMFDEVMGILEGLQDYPLIDEEHHSNLEMELQNEAWDNWCRDDFIKAIEKEYPDYDFNWEKMGEVGNTGSEKLFLFFIKASEKANEYWECETGGNMWIDLDRIVKKVEWEDIEDYLIAYSVVSNSVGEEKEVYYSEDEAEERVSELRENGDIGAYYCEVV